MILATTLVGCTGLLAPEPEVDYGHPDEYITGYIAEYGQPSHRDYTQTDVARYYWYGLSEYAYTEGSTDWYYTKLYVEVSGNESFGYSITLENYYQLEAM
jgi:hypothetical protein